MSTILSTSPFCFWIESLSFEYADDEPDLGLRSITQASGVDLDGVASFHGILPTSGPENKDPKPKAVIFHGGDDPFVPDEQMDAFKKAMANANVDYDIVVYPGVKHSFTNPGADAVGEKFAMPLKYDAQADEDSWQRTQAFFAEIFAE